MVEPGPVAWPALALMTSGLLLKTALFVGECAGKMAAFYAAAALAAAICSIGVLASVRGMTGSRLPVVSLGAWIGLCAGIAATTVWVKQRFKDWYRKIDF